MRRGNKPDVVTINGVFVGFTLDADFCSEHEWGIKRTQSDFGMDPKAIGLKGRTITKLPEHFAFFPSGKDEAVLAYTQYTTVTPENFKKGHFSTEMGARDWFSDRDKKEGKDKLPRVGAAWSDGDFGIHVVGAEYVARLKEVYEAFLKKDVSIWLGGGGVFQNAGLVVAITSLLPKEIDEGMTSSDLNYKALQKAKDDTGIEKILADAGKRYYALSPRWKDASKTEVVFWLNPMEQHLYNYGNFSVDDLKLWAKNLGPIIMKKKEGAKS